VDYQSNSEVGSLGIEKPPDLGFALSFNEIDKVRREGSCYLAVISLHLVEKDSLEQIIGSWESRYLRNGSSNNGPWQSWPLLEPWILERRRTRLGTRDSGKRVTRVEEMMGSEGLQLIWNS